MPGVAARCLLVGLAVVFGGRVAAAADEFRTWTDRTGKHKVVAKLVAVEDDAVRLENADGKQVVTPLARLCEADRRYAGRAMRRSNSAPRPAVEGAAATDDARLAEHAERFFADLRSEEREEAASLLSAAARAIVAEGKSPLAALPTPDDDDRAIRVGDPAVDGDQATTPVFVRARGDRVKTALHFVREEDAWRITAISATGPNGERTIRFDDARETKPVDPLLALVGKPMPIEGLTSGGERFTSDAFRGKVVLVDFWATWCASCRAELPNIAAAYQEHHDQGFEVVAVSVDGDMAALGAYVEQEQPPWVVLADRHPEHDGSMGARYGIRSLPSLVLIGRDGKVAAVHCRGKTLGPAIAKALRKRAPEGLASR